MKRLLYCISLLFLLIVESGLWVNAQWKAYTKEELKFQFQNPPEEAKPWVIWYWMRAAVSREGIKADLESMKENGIHGAYLVPIGEQLNPPLIEPPVNTFNPEWWQLVQYAFAEAKRLGLKISMHCGDGYATAGGRWITPENSMQKVVWSTCTVEGKQVFSDTLSKPPTVMNFYRDIAVLAFPSPEGTGISTQTIKPIITTSIPGVDASFLISKNNRETFRCDDSCWIQYEFKQPFTCRSIITKGSGTNYQAHRLRVEYSNDGINFMEVCRLKPPKHGWQDTDADYTHSIPSTKARFFRFIFSKVGTEPGAEDLDNAKWKQNLKLKSLQLSSEAVINQYEGKSGLVWRIGERTSSAYVPAELCVPQKSIIDLTENFKDSKLRWNIPEGKWTIMRIGYTTTGHMNETAGAAKGLECDKLNPEAAKLQFNNWYGEIERKLGKELVSDVLENIHVDSWECGSQNWSPVFRNEFLKRRGYDLLPYLPAMAGIPVESADISERFLYDVRQTIAELVADNFYGTLYSLAKSKGYGFSAESVSPVGTSDGMLHFKNVDYPMGEFWVNSPTHDKPTDMLDAISAGRIYGKNIIQAEAFTTLRMDWNENPSNLKTTGDRNLALGANRFVFHVFCQNPWPGRKPGMTLGPIGLFFQPAQTWWKPGRAWIEYITRCQALLQKGVPEVDIAVFTGEEFPRRALLPSQVIQLLPAIANDSIVERNKRRLLNIGQPQQEKPDGINCSANIFNPAEWVNPVPGYQYVSFNKDALLNNAKVVDGKVCFSDSPGFKLLIFPAQLFKIENQNWMSPELVSKIMELIQQGAQVMITDFPECTSSLTEYPLNDKLLNQMSEKLKSGLSLSEKKKDTYEIKEMGNGILIHGIYNEKQMFEPDVIIKDSAKRNCTDVAWTHRINPNFDIYFISNQLSTKRKLFLSLRVTGRIPEIWDPVTGEIYESSKWHANNNRTGISLEMAANQSLFVIFEEAEDTKIIEKKKFPEKRPALTLEGTWKIQFDTAYGGPVDEVLTDKLTDWTQFKDSSIRFYSGTATYLKDFNWSTKQNKGKSKIWIDLGNVKCIASIKINGADAGTVWTFPFRLEISRYLKPGINHLEIAVTNTWINRIIGDNRLPENRRITRNAFPFYRIEDKNPKESGLIGPVTIYKEK